VQIVKTKEQIPKTILCIFYFHKLDQWQNIFISERRALKKCASGSYDHEENSPWNIVEDKKLVSFIIKNKKHTPK
jgi:hypothetical protein